MMDLTELCIDLDNHHKKLFSKYEKKLKLSEPKAGFLSDDCFTPKGEDECYPWMEYSFKHILEILKKLKAKYPEEVHQWLGVVVFCGVNVKKNCTEKNHKFFPKIQQVLNQARYFLSVYEYKRDPKYKQNLAFLIMAKYYRLLKKSYFKNFSPTKKILKQNRLETEENKKFKRELTLEKIAQLVVQSQSKGINARSLTFIAIGIRADGQHVITTNYHAPVVYRLADMLDETRYQQIEVLRNQYKAEHGAAFLKFDRTIHAETMIAAVSSALDVETIILIDGLGKKKQNCGFCSTFLQTKGFGSEPHFEAIQNYSSPLQQQTEQAIAWFNYLISEDRELVKAEEENEVDHDFLSETSNKLDEDHSNNHSYDKIISLLDQNSQSATLSLEPQEKPEFIFNIVKSHYPTKTNDLHGSYHQSYKLAHAEDAEIERTFNWCGEIKTTPYSNNKIQLLNDGRLKIDDDNPKHLAPVDPGSPRSRKISKYCNEWLDAEKKHSRIEIDQEQDVITLSRNTRAMK